MPGLYFAKMINLVEIIPKNRRFGNYLKFENHNATYP